MQIDKNNNGGGGIPEFYTLQEVAEAAAETPCREKVF